MATSWSSFLCKRPVTPELDVTLGDPCGERAGRFACLTSVAVFLFVLVIIWASSGTGVSSSSRTWTFTGRDAQRRKSLESQGLTGRTNPELDRLNRKLTNSLSADEIRRRYRERKETGRPTGQLEAAARDRGIDLD